MSRPATARLFVAIDPPAAVCEECAAWARAAFAHASAGAPSRVTRGVRLLEPDTMHMTLCFLGSRPVAELASIAIAVQELSSPGAELSLGAPLWLPPRRPRALALAVHDRGGELQRLHRALARALSSAIDWHVERRRFKAHVTVARLGRERAHGQLAAAAQAALPPSPQLSFAARAVVLYRSWLAPGGASYEALASSALADSSDSSSAGGEGLGEGPAVP
jgi:RNA 2',3'-cyclic 3'-phosphodiesterase